MCVRWRINASTHCCSTRHRRNIQRSRGLWQQINRELNISIRIGTGVTKAQYIDATLDLMEKTVVFNTCHVKWIEAAANVLQEDVSKQMCHLKQTCTPKGAARTYLTTVTNAMILNYAIGLDLARGTGYVSNEYLVYFPTKHQKNIGQHICRSRNVI